MELGPLRKSIVSVRNPWALQAPVTGRKGKAEREEKGVGRTAVGEHTAL